MATEKDTTMGDLEACNDVFADIMNVLLFGGEEYVKEADLEQEREKSSYEPDGGARVRPQYRDIHKFWKNCEVRLAYIGMENQTEPEDDMPFRTIGYDGAAYRDQIRYETDENGKRHKITERYPVITLVLYMGYKKRWDKAKSLYEALDDKIDERLKPFVNDYRVHLFEIAFLEDEDVKKFKSDFRIVADYLVQMRKNHEYKPEPIEMRHVREVLNAMKALTGDRRIEEVYARMKKGGEVKTMYDMIGSAERRGEERGLQIGEERGIQIGEKKGKKIGEKNATKLINYLWLNGRGEDAQRAEQDKDFFDRLLAEFNDDGERGDIR